MGADSVTPVAAGGVARDAGWVTVTEAADPDDASAFGVELVLNLHGCAPDTVRSPDRLAAYVRDLCELIGMRRYGDLFAERFGLNETKTTGYSIVQLIETSSITGHFSEARNAAYLNIFSCKEFDIDAATAFTAGFFGATSVERHVLTRR
ncbi:S-adenosylmethionine decarboxylase family protein [Plantactinospora sp. GCM10030261]|uniref:S-adenosylmethionine decarboxylase family protein n=1 Tax=Plantactinospora sp. GCM10030261 TaxID=3273420 RepID=UPI0036190C1A